MQRKMASVHSSLGTFKACFQLLLLIFPLCCSLLERLDAVGVNRRAEVNALLSFRNANTASGAAPNRRYAGNWFYWTETDETPCTWVGVTCTANDTVEELDFAGWGLTLNTLDGLYNLKDLRHLDLSSNSVGYQEGIRKFTGLTYSDLSQTSLSPEFLSGISACRTLRFLALQQNYLSAFPSGMRDLVNLQFLNLSDNLLVGPFPKEELGGLRNLITLDLSQNSLEGIVPSLPNLISLGELRLDNNSFTGFEEPWVLGTKSLQHFSISNNRLQGMIPSSIPDSVNLAVLDMSNNSLSGNIPAGFSAQLDFGFQLDLSQNQLSGEIPSDFLENSGDHFDQECPFLNVSHNQLIGNIPINVGNMSCFSMLDLSYNNLSGVIPSNNFIYAAGIGSLYLQNNKLSGDIVDIFFSTASFLRSVDELHLQNNLFTGDLSRLANTNLESRRVLDLSNNHLQWSISESIPDPVKATLEALSFTGSMQDFRVAGNNFSGTTLPTECFASASSSTLATLDLSNCQLEGQILGSAFSNSCLPSLQLLNLSNNLASGPLLDSIIVHSQPFVVDVSNNNLSGPLPIIASTSNLYNPRYFAGNYGLCGYPLTPCLPPKQGTGVQWWVLLIIIGGSVTIAMGSCLVATWRWRAYQKQHEQDADLIRTLLERDAATLMPLRALKKATDNFAKSAQIGEGGFGTVYLGKLTNGTIVAIKRSKREGSERDKQQFLNEVRILSQVNHRHLVKLLGCCMENKIAALVFQFVANGTLQQHLQGKLQANHLSWKQRLKIAVQAADALYYLHSAASFPIFHRDVKSANILLDENLDAKVAVFGISKLAPLHATHVSTAAIQGTMGYIDPEYYTSFQLNDRSDVYSFGVVLLELMSSKPALEFGRGGDETSLVNLARPYIERGDLEQFIDPVLVETYKDPTLLGKESILNIGRLAMKCLEVPSRGRPSMNEVLTELQNLWHKISDTHKNLDSINEGERHDLQQDNVILLSDSLSGNSSTFTSESGKISIEMSRLSPLPRFRSRSME